MSATISITTLIRELDTASDMGVGLYCPIVPVRESTAEELALIEATDINATIAGGGSVEWSRGVLMFRIEKAAAIGADIWFAFEHGEVCCRVTVDRALRSYSLTWTPANARQVVP